LDTTVSPAKTAEPTEMLTELWSWTDLRNHLLIWVQIIPGKRQFCRSKMHGKNKSAKKRYIIYTIYIPADIVWQSAGVVRLRIHICINTKSSLKRRIVQIATCKQIAMMSKSHKATALISDVPVK